MTSVGVLDYGSGNLHSVSQALTAVGATVVASSDWHDLDGLDGLVLPGVGAFAACMSGIGLTTAQGYRPWLADWLAAGRPLLGICVGHQVLFDRGVEHRVTTAGLGMLPGVVEQLPSKRLPHIGWNTVEATSGSAMFAGIGTHRFYFVHSYAVLTDVPGAKVTWCEHEDARFVAAVEKGPIWSTQFHPEKSGKAGATLLRNWLEATNHSVMLCGS